MLDGIPVVSRLQEQVTQVEMHIPDQLSILLQSTYKHIQLDN